MYGVGHLVGFDICCIGDLVQLGWNVDLIGLGWAGKLVCLEIVSCCIFGWVQHLVRLEISLGCIVQGWFGAWVGFGWDALRFG